MRRIIAMAATVALAAGGVLSAPLAYADNDAVATQEPTAPAVTDPSTQLGTLPALPQAGAATVAPRAALTTARRVLAGNALRRDPSATV
ncbi:MAG: hypothetical protein JWN84_1656, partial [Nocardioides sp.]|nr:hypothetical protein [Nocardioides sp.]